MTIFPKTLNFCMFVESCYLGTVKGTVLIKWQTGKLLASFKTKMGINIWFSLCCDLFLSMKKIKNKRGYLIMLLHSCAHFLHMSAHCLHISILSPIFSHSIAHASHMSAHMLHICFAYSLPLHIIMDAILHMSAQSLHIIMHLPIIPAIWAFDVVMHSVQQASQAIMHSLQLSMQPESLLVF